MVGHTIQEGGINSACGGRVFRVDVGLSRGCGNGSPEVLEVLDDSVVRRLSEVQQENVAPAVPAAAAAAQKQQQQQEQVAAAVAAAAVMAAGVQGADGGAVLQGRQQQQQQQAT